MKKKLAVFSMLLLGIIFIVATQIMAQGTWTTQNSGTSNTLRSVDFFDPVRGWAVGDAGTILHTSNGGATWTQQPTGRTNTLNSVSFVSGSTGWAVGSGGLILRTTDVGATWTQQPTGRANSLQSVSFVNATTGWAVGTGGLILRTTNGGATWTAQTSGVGTLVTLNSVHFINATTGWAVGSEGTILRTGNGGATWTRQNSGTSSSLRSVDFVDISTGWVVGNDGTILFTSDSGLTWVRQNSGTNNILLDVDFTNRQNGWAVGTGGTVLHTTNTGLTWTPQGVTGGQIWSVDFPFANIGWAVGQGGSIIKYQDTGNGTTTTTQPGATTSTTVLGTTTTTTRVPGTFSDVASTDWFYTYVRDLALANIISGYTDGTFKPQNSITRAEFAKVIVLATGNIPSTASSSFPDVASSHWARGYIERAKELGFMTGYPDGAFRPDSSISRQEIAKVVVLANGSTPATAYRAAFTDVPESLWSWPYVIKAADLGIVSGYPNGEFRPVNAATRAEAAKMVKTMIDVGP